MYAFAHSFPCTLPRSRAFFSLRLHSSATPCLRYSTFSPCRAFSLSRSHISRLLSEASLFRAPRPHAFPLRLHSSAPSLCGFTLLHLCAPAPSRFYFFALPRLGSLTLSHPLVFSLRLRTPCAFALSHSHVLAPLHSCAPFPRIFSLRLHSCAPFVRTSAPTRRAASACFVNK